jgi:DNA repair protein RecN (Recombination protein N)
MLSLDKVAEGGERTTMLRDLQIQGLAIIERLNVEFGPGLTTITGETGAGKSLLLGALRLLLGQRASSDLVAAGTTRAMVQAAFAPVTPELCAFLRAYGLDPEEDAGESQLLVRREVLASGGSRHFVNDVAVTLARLEELGRLLVAIHGQNDQALLLQPATQLALLDAFGQCEPELDAYRHAYESAGEAARRLRELMEAARHLEQRREFLRFQVDEIDRAHLLPGEEKEIESDLLRLRHAQRLFEVAQELTDRLYEGERTPLTAVQILGECESLLDEVVKYDEALQEPQRQLAELRVSLENVAADLRAYARTLETDPHRLDELEERRELIRSLSRKYGRTTEEILAARETLAAELAELENYEISLARAQADFDEAMQELENAAAALGRKRKAAARDFEQRVEREMQALSLAGATFHVSVAPRRQSPDSPGETGAATASEEDGRRGAGDQTPSIGQLVPAAYGPSGAETVEFLVVMNVGDEPRPLRRIASGGELSRIMLAIECVLAAQDKTPTLVFDEVDAGISGEAAERVGAKLRELAASHQVLCVTHLPQIAACGHRQFVVEKSVHGGRTVVHIRAVEGAEREEAVARMLAGDKVDASTRSFARRLLERRA